MLDKDTAAQINDMMHSALGKQSVKKQVSQVARIVAVNSGQYYDLAPADNSCTHSSVPTMVPSLQFRVGDWVTFEWTGTDYIITGSGATSAGDGT